MYFLVFGAYHYVSDLICSLSYINNACELTSQHLVLFAVSVLYVSTLDKCLWRFYTRQQNISNRQLFKITCLFFPQRENSLLFLS